MRSRSTAAGRTDAGVHALMQVAHFDSAAPRAPRAWVLGSNTELPAEISVLWATPVPERFHARYSALSRTYVYRIVNQSCRPALLRGTGMLGAPVARRGCACTRPRRSSSASMTSRRSARRNASPPRRCAG